MDGPLAMKYQKPCQEIQIDHIEDDWKPQQCQLSFCLSMEKKKKKRDKIKIKIKVESFYDVKYWNVNYYVKCSSENCWVLVCCFFSEIWNISQINVLKTKCKSKCQNIFFWETMFEIWKHQYLFFMFSLLRFIWWTFDNFKFSIWRRIRTPLMFQKVGCRKFTSCSKILGFPWQ